jgi:pimeloyl-ACP methyl ester carboxylesterase
MTHYRKADVDGLKIFYRECGAAEAPTLLLLHGFPTASHMFRDLIPLLEDRLHLVAPDLPGFGQSDMPSRDAFRYTFAALAGVIDRFTEVVRLDRYAMYVFDYGSPVGLRIAARHPERITAIISQNGNAYEEGLSDAWDTLRTYWREPTQMHRDGLRGFLSPETTVWQYTHGVPDRSRVSPDGYSLDNHYMERPGAHEVQLDLLLDYASNIALYPEWEELAAIPETYATAWTCLFRNLELEAGQTLVIRGATSSFGRAAINMAVNAGARVIATTRNQSRAPGLEALGALRVELEGPDLATRIAERKQIDAVLNLVGNSTLLDSLAMLRRGGRACLAGFLGGLTPLPNFDPLTQMPSGVHFSFFGSFVFGTPGFPLSDVPLQAIADQVAAGRYRAKPWRVFRFDDIREAHRVMEANEAGGKMVVRIDGSGELRG